MDNTQWYVAIILVGMWGYKKLSDYVQILYASVAVFRKAVRVELVMISGMTDISCMGCMFQDIQTELRGFLSVVFCLTNVKLLPPAL